MPALTVPDCPRFWIKYPTGRDGAETKRETRTDLKLNLSTNRRKLGAIGLIAASVIAFSIPFLLHSPTSANTTTSNPKGPGTTGTNTNPNTNPSGTSTNPSGSGDNGNGSKGNEACDNDNDTKTGDPPGHAYAYGHSKNGNHDKDGLGKIMERLHRLGSDKAAHHQTHSTKTDNHLNVHDLDEQGNSEVRSVHGAACRDDEEAEKD